MKKLNIIFAFIFLFTLFSPNIVYANMASPYESDISSDITFEKNDSIAVLYEVLDITIQGTKANINAIYTLKNTTNENITTSSMFLSPNIDNGNVSIVINNENIDFETESYILDYDTEIKTEDWQYIVLSQTTEEYNDKYSEQYGPYSHKTIDTILFSMDFQPLEEYEVSVSYTYNLGGFPHYDDNNKYGFIQYYLSPANMWESFGGITINLYLDKDMPIIKNSNIEFTKIDSRVYQYKSDTIPIQTLAITIDENWVQTIFSTLRNPYIIFLIILLLIFIITISLIIFTIRKIYKVITSHFKSTNK